MATKHNSTHSYNKIRHKMHEILIHHDRTTNWQSTLPFKNMMFSWGINPKLQQLILKGKYIECNTEICITDASLTFPWQLAIRQHFQKEELISLKQCSTSLDSLSHPEFFDNKDNYIIRLFTRKDNDMSWEERKLVLITIATSCWTYDLISETYLN